MNILVELFIEFFKIGLFAVGGGPATLPFLMDLTELKPWFTMQDLTNMIAVSESTPGPLGLNMSTYAGYQTAGIIGGITATFALVLPSLVIIMLIAKFLENFNKNRYVQAAFKMIRPAVTALIASAVLNVFRASLFIEVDGKLILSVGSLIIAIVVVILIQLKPCKKIHPFFWFVAGAAAGCILRL